MIALPGLTLATGRADIAKQILLAFARFVDGGMLPNNFPDAGGRPNTTPWTPRCGFSKPCANISPPLSDTATLRELFP